MSEDYDLKIQTLLRHNRRIRSVGFDDAPFRRGQAQPVAVAGVVCANTRFEGMVWEEVTLDGDDATDVLGRRVAESKFAEQLHVALFDGIAVAGFNIVDVPLISQRLNLPVLTVMRDEPNWPAIEAALQHVDDRARRLATMKRAGSVHRGNGVFFQSCGLRPDTARQLLCRITRHGHIPEPVRMAHLIASAVATGESGRRA